MKLDELLKTVPGYEKESDRNEIILAIRSMKRMMSSISDRIEKLLHYNSPARENDRNAFLPNLDRHEQRAAVQAIIEYWRKEREAVRRDYMNLLIRVFGFEVEDAKWK